MKKLLPITLMICFATSAIGQVSYKEHFASYKKSHTFDPKKVDLDYNARIVNQEAPSPNGEDYKAFLAKQKIESQKMFPRKKNTTYNRQKTQNAAQPVVGHGLSMYRTLLNGATVDYSGGIPNDNALAVSNDGILVAGVNSVIWAYDTNADTTLFSNEIASLASVGNGTSSGRYFDPKMIYDEKADRFILVFLRDNLPATSAFIVCFSSTNNPLDPWNAYEIPGNPLDNNRWTDFPAISITEDELFITGNLIIPDVTWQVGFDGSVIWQINKEDGFSNQDSLRTKLFHQISYEGKFTRNVHPVRGTASAAGRQFFLSNRNFDLTNDSIFVMEIEGTLENSSLNVQMGKTTPNYGVPPNGRQQDTDLSDPTKGLQTNDARVLGAITNDDWIQFVSTTVNPATGYAGIYHGTIQNPLTENQQISGTIISDPVKDFGYPNLVFTGNEECDIETIIGFNHTSPTDFPGVSALFYDNDGNYSEVVTLKEGLNYADAHSDSYERWGDYFGIQTKYNEPGKVWTVGYFGMTNNQNGNWINELTSPDSSTLNVSVSELGSTVFCQGSLQFTPSGGLPPYQYSYNGGTFSSLNLLDSICDNDTVMVSVVDSRGCSIADTIIIEKLAQDGEGVYPNPFSSQLVVQFEMESTDEVKAYILGMNGQIVDEVIKTQAKKGSNELIMDLSPLRSGTYVLKIFKSDDSEVLAEKIFKW